MKYLFFDKDTKKFEEVVPEKWQWEAHFFDGTVLKQFGDDGTFHQFKEIDQNKLMLFKMVSIEGRSPYTLFFDPQKMKLIHFYRRTRLNVGTPAEQRITLYCFGYETNINGIVHKVIMAILPNDELIVTDDLNKLRLGGPEPPVS